MKIAVFGPEAGNPSIARRIKAMQSLGHDVVGLCLRRDDDRPRGWHNIDLGRSYDARFAQRLLAIARGTGRALSHVKTDFAGVDLLWARNLDMLAIAAAVRARFSPKPPLVYETLDIHQSLTGTGRITKIMRSAERRLMRSARSVVISSPAFEREYYQKLQPDHPPISLLENWLNSDEMPPRPTTFAPFAHDRPLRLGWVGILRCKRTLELLADCAARFDGRVEVHLHGKPSLTAVPEFQDVVDRTPHFFFHGPYAAPDGLSDVYGSLDVVWAGDFFQAGANSRWLLPNRIYEGGYFGVPALAPAGTETADWLARHRIGLAVNEPLEKNLPAELQHLLTDGALRTMRERVTDAPKSLFARDASPLQSVINEVVSQ